MSRDIEFEGISNVRDLGGMPVADGGAVRTGVLFRGGQLALATPNDIARLANGNVRLVVDFRNPVEVEEKPDPDIEGVRNLWLPVFSDQRAGITHDTESNMGVRKYFSSGEAVDPSVTLDHMRKMYRSFVEDPYSAAQYGRFVDALIATAEQGGAAFWHCTVGKDRAGFATVVLLEALGVSRDAIVDDYLHTNGRITATMEDFIASAMNMDVPDSSREALANIFAADATYLESAYDAVKARYGSFDGYLSRAVGLDDNKRVHLQDLLAE